MAGGNEPKIMELVQAALDSTGLRLRIDSFKRAETGIHLHIFVVDEQGQLVREWYDGFLLKGGLCMTGDFGSMDEMPVKQRTVLYDILRPLSIS